VITESFSEAAALLPARQSFSVHCDIFLYISYSFCYISFALQSVKSIGRKTAEELPSLVVL
jgi:hypothetical protein